MLCIVALATEGLHTASDPNSWDYGGIADGVSLA